MKPNYFTCTLGQAAALGIQQPDKTANDLVDTLAERRPDSPAVGFPTPGAQADLPWKSSVFSFSDVKDGRDGVAQRLLAECGNKLSQCRTIGLLCPSTPQFLFTWLALMRLGHAVLLIAPQCQPAAIANLCKNCEVNVLLYDQVYVEQAETAAKVAAADGSTLSSILLPLDEELIPPSGSSEGQSGTGSEVLPNAHVEESDVAYLHHTSGTSSGMPKPIPQTHRAGVGVLPSFEDGHAAATFTTTPLYHGGIADLFRAWTSGGMIWLFPGKHVPITTTNIVKCLDMASEGQQQGRTPPVRYFSSVPYVLQMMEADQRGLQYLRDMEIVGVGGAALPDEVGQRLVESGVNLISRFGSAECGFLLSSHRDYDADKEWQYLRVASGAEEYLRFEPQTEDTGLSELIVLSGWPHMAKRNRDDGSYATSDLFAPHPSIPNAWRYHSRADSQLTLITGKKFDPAPLEASIATSELLDDVLIFGNGQPYPGALLLRSQDAEALSHEDLLEQIWPMIEKLNSESQDHARISKAMLVPMKKLERPLEKSSKGTILRGAAEKRFQHEIDGAYTGADAADDAEEVPDEELPSVVTDMIKSAVVKGGELSETSNLFSYGVDSVAGMQIRGKLRRLLPKDDRQLPINVVEDCGTIERLAQYVKRRRHGQADTNGTAEDELAYMHELVEQYSRFDDNPRPSTNGSTSTIDGEGDVVVMTGATGALGAHVLDQYRAKASVKKIYCLVRGADEHAAYERVNKALTQRQLMPLDVANIASKQIVVLQAVLGAPQLGLESAQYDQIAREATIIMHVAWSVNFRIRLRSFVKDNIAGVTNLINLALASPRAEPPVFGFCSSVASAMRYSGGDPIPEAILDDPAVADEKGYSRSKWVAEQICQRASASTRMTGRIKVFRVGQLAGDTVHGVWNIKEAWPMMLSAVKVTQSLPALENEPLAWLAVDIAAAALIQGTEVNNDGDKPLSVFHILNQHAEPSWTDLLGWLHKHRAFDAVPPATWVEQLEAAVNAGSTHPASQLLDHWKQTYCAADRETIHEHHQQQEAGGGSTTFAMTKTTAAIAALERVEPVSEIYFDRMWRWIEQHV